MNDEKWFANKGQLIQVALSALACVLAGMKAIPDLGNGLAKPLPAAFALFAISTIASVQRIIVRSKRRKELNWLLDLHENAQSVMDGYLELVRRWPNSVAVNNPFILIWRPSVGETKIDADVTAVMAWMNTLGEFLTLAGKNDKLYPTQNLKILTIFDALFHQRGTNNSLTVIMALRELEASVQTEWRRRLLQ
jgi:hypothetical protein